MYDDIGQSGRSSEVQSVKEIELFRCCLTGAVEGVIPDMGRVFLNAGQPIENGARTCAVTLGVQAHGHDAVSMLKRSTTSKILCFKK